MSTRGANRRPRQRQRDRPSARAPRPGPARRRSGRAAGGATLVVPSRLADALGRAAGLAVVGCAFALSWRKIGDFDTWWHLASGRWIAAHHAIPSTDTLSHTVRDHAWINLQWAFDLALYGLDRMGGATLMCLAGALVFSAAIALVLVMATRAAGRTLGAILALLVVLAAQERALLRPELLSFLLLAAVVFVLDHARRRDERGLFLLVPLMLVWVNVHALFALGAVAIVCGAIGTGRTPSRRFLVWAAAALAVTFVNPYGIRGVLFPLTLVSRINGSSSVFQTVGEFASPFAPNSNDLSTVVYKILLFGGGVLALAALRRSLRHRGARDADERFDWGGLALFTGLAVVSIEARRNMAIFAIGAAPFLARGLATATRRRAAGPLARLGPAASLAVAGTAMLVAASAVTGAFYRWDREPQEFGGGVMDGIFPVRAAAFARAAALPGTLYNDMLGGGYLAWDDPIGDGVFVDGRLEVYDTPFLTEYTAASADPVRWQADADRYGVQTAIICHRFEADRVLVGRLFHDPRWTMVYADESAAVFVRTEGNAAAIARSAAVRPAWDARTQAWLSAPAIRRPYPAGRVEGTHAYARFLATIGSAEPAVRAYQRLLELGIPADDEVDVRLLLLRRFASTGRTSEASEQARRILALQPDNSEARGFPH